jgi:hypothetical protein
MKGSEKDFVGAPNDCVLIVKCNSNGMLYQLGDHHNVIAIEQCGDDIIAQREPVNECTLQDGVVFDAPIGVPINEFKCRHQSLNANDSDIRINGIPIGEFSAKAYVEVVKYDQTKADGEQRVKCGELKIDGEMHDATINKYTRECKGVQVDVYDVLQAFNVTNPALQHLIKKALCVGIRGHKTKQQDLQDIIDSAIRAKELEQ